MGLKVKKDVMWGNQQFNGYEIIGIEWLFRNDTIYVLTEYFYTNQNVRRLVKHPFPGGTDVNVDKLIEQVHKLNG
jgi:hypothetical protein